MKAIAWMLILIGGLMALGPAVILAIVYLKISWNNPAYQDTYYITYSLGWPTLVYFAFALTTLVLGVWLLMKSKKG